MRLLISILLLSGFYYTQPINAASDGAGAHAGTWKPAGPLLDVLRYKGPASDVYHKDASMEAYFSRMDREDKPRVLIVGCGHYDREVTDWKPEGDHIHPDAWCVDIEDPNKFDPMVTVHKKEGYAPDYKDRLRKTKANDCLDITTTVFPAHYAGKFDIVLLERIWSTPLSNPYTYYNVAQALKPEGYLFIEFGPGYGVGNSHFIDTAIFAQNILKVIKPSHEEAIYACYAWLDSIPREDTADEIIDKYIANCKGIYVDARSSLSFQHNAMDLNGELFLQFLFFDAVSYVGMTSPFSERHSLFLLAKKTDLTQELLKPYTYTEQLAAQGNSELTGTSELEDGTVVRINILSNPLLDAIRAVYPHGM